MSGGRKKEILVRHRVFNKNEVALQRKNWCGIWKDWKLLNQPLYNIDESIVKKLKEVEDLLNKRKGEEDFLKHQMKEIDSSTRQTVGFSIPFLMLVKVNELPFNKQKWGSPVDGSWRDSLSKGLLKRTGAIKGGRDRGGRSGESTRDKMGLESIPGIRISSAYLSKDIHNFRASLEETDQYDNVIDYREPNQQKSGKKKKNQNNEGNSQDN